MKMGKTRKFVLLGGCIFVFFFLHGLAHEKVTKATYVNPDGTVEYYSCSLSLVFIYCGANFVLSSILQRFFKEEDTTPTVYHCAVSLVYVLAMTCANLALQFISFPTQVVAKSCKPIPVMIFGVLLGKKKYSFKKYIFVMMVVSGVFMFMYKEVKEKKEVAKSQGFGIGELLILSSLFMDGIIAAGQERMRSEYQAASLSMMTNLNKWATVYLAVLWFLTSEVFRFVSFLQRHPSVIWKLCSLSICGFFGQLAMISMVLEFGPLPATMVATVRKFCTVLTSVLLLGNTLLLRQWLATVLIFSGLFLDVLYGKSETKVK